MSLAVKWSAVLKPTLAKKTRNKSTGPAMINKAGPAIVLMLFKSSCSQAFWRAFRQALELKACNHAANIAEVHAILRFEVRPLEALRKWSAS
jgi:hypothetical protein